MERKKYIIYRAIAPDNRYYVGYTSMGLSERWRHHKKRAINGEAPEHPFYNAIRSFGADKFRVEEICHTFDRFNAMILEEHYISETPANLSMNLSSGGVNDASEGGRIFWERLNADTEAKAAFIKKLSDRKKQNDWTDYDSLLLNSQKWRHEHPKEAYRMSYRAIRIARRQNGQDPPCFLRTDNRPYKEQLISKYRQHEKRSTAVKLVWQERSEEEKAVIAEKISKAQRHHFSTLSEEEKRKATEKARASIDRKKQGTAASKGIKAWWAKLKSNPDAYKAYIEARTKTLLKNRSKHNENI